MNLQEQLSRMKSLAGIYEAEENIIMPQDQVSEEQPIESTPDGKTEVNVTDIINNTEDNSNKLDDLTNKLQDLKNDLKSMTDMNPIKDMINQFRQEITTQIQQANPTPIQKLELRSLDSAPFSTKLGDYWSTQKPANYEIESIPQSNFKVDGITYDKPNYTITDVDVMEYEKGFDQNYNVFY